jgi:hypothetical protein
LYQNPELASIGNEDEEIPLRWAIRLSAPNEIIRLLLSVHPSSACCVKDRDGYTALLMVWERHESLLLDQWWNYGKTLLNRNKRWTGILFFLQCYSDYLNVQKVTTSSSENDGSDEIMEHARHFWPLHTATQCPSCPLMLFTFLLRVYKDEIHHPNDDGRLPLALAREEDWDEGIDKLISFDTKSLLLCDPVTRLPAFLLAAAKVPKSKPTLYAMQRLIDEVIGLNIVLYTQF